MKALILYNPVAGTGRGGRESLAQAAAKLLRQQGFEVSIEATHAKGSATAQAQQAIARGCQAIFACGGDGTVHEVLQAVAGSSAILGILPAGSANALARELAIPRDPVKAASSYRPGRTVNVRVTTLQRPDQLPVYFLALAGAGPDGTLMYRMLTTSRSRWGHWLYYLHALRLFLRQSFPPFRVQYLAAINAGWRE